MSKQYQQDSVGGASRHVDWEEEIATSHASQVHLIKVLGAAIHAHVIYTHAFVFNLYTSPVNRQLQYMVNQQHVS